MATENSNDVAEKPVDAVATTATEETPAADTKGKGKAVASAEEPRADTAMDEDDDDEEEDDDEGADDAEDDEDGGDGEGISLDNVVGRRTRGKVIDFAKAAEENPALEDDDSEDDEDFEDDDDKMDED